MFRPKTEILNDLSTVTRDGIAISFIGIQVISSVKIEKLIPLIKLYGMEFKRVLIYDRIAEDLRIFCANHTIDEVYNSMFLDIVENVKIDVEDSIRRLGQDGVKILNLVVPKPDIPDDIAENYKKVKVQWTEQLVAQQEQKTAKIKVYLGKNHTNENTEFCLLFQKETENLKAKLDAQREKDVTEIELERRILEKEGEKKRNEIDNQIIKAREENLAEVEFIKKQKAAEGNKILFTPEYLKIEMAKSMSNNTKFFFSGEGSPLGSLLSKILDN